MERRGYQLDFARGNVAMHSAEGRLRKARTLLAVLEDAIGPARLSEARVLNIGCSTGHIDEAVAGRVGEVVGIDIDRDAVAEAGERCQARNARFEIGDAMKLDFADGSFDVAICSQVYEHVPDPYRMIAEMHRVLRPGGVAYFAATNRFCLMEKHYHLPFLSIIPVGWANVYLRATGRGTSYHERHLTYGQLRRLVAPFHIDDYTRSMLAAPERFHFEYMMGSRLRSALVRAFAALAYPAFPGYVWILRKRDAAR